MVPNSAAPEQPSVFSEVNMDRLLQSLQSASDGQVGGDTMHFHDATQLPVPQSEFGRNMYEVLNVHIPRVRALARDAIDGM